MRPEWLVDITAIPRGGRPRNRVSIAGKLKRFFSYSNCSDRLWGHSVCSLGARWAVPGGKVGGGGGREADPSPSSGGEAKNDWS